MEIKVSMTIILPGAIMWSKEECLKTTQKEITRKRKNGQSYKKVINIQVEDPNKMDKCTVEVSDSKGKNYETLTVYTRKCRSATQSINLCKDTYDYMVSKECPEWCKVSMWNQMGKKARLEAHLKRIAEHLGGKLQSYQVFDD